MLLTQACARENLRILEIHTDYRHKRHLENLSLLKGEKVICLVNRTGDVVLKVKDGRIAINREFASLIDVESLNPQDFQFEKKMEGHGKGKHEVVFRRPTKEAEERFKREDREMAAQEKEAKKRLKELRNRKKEEHHA